MVRAQQERISWNYLLQLAPLVSLFEISAQECLTFMKVGTGWMYHKPIGDRPLCLVGKLIERTSKRRESNIFSLKTEFLTHGIFRN